MIKQIFIEFLKLGFIAFGGPAGHIALMHKRFVEELKWLDEKHFLDLISLSSMIPGPSSTELTLLIGRHKGGKLGLWVAGISFITPALLIVLGLSYVYVRFGNVDMFQNIFYYVLPVMVGIIISVTYTLSKKVIKRPYMIVYMALALLLSFVLNQVWIFIIVGMIRYGWIVLNEGKQRLHEGISMLSLFLIFFQIGATLYGSGYVLTSYLDTFFVQTELLTLQQMMDAITVGQITPGPVFTTAAFIGYVLTQNIWGGLFSAIGIFLPGFLLITFLYGWFDRLRHNPRASQVLDVLQLVAIALLLKVIGEFFIFMATDWILLMITLISTILLVVVKIKPTWLIMLGVIFSVVLTFT